MSNRRPEREHRDRPWRIHKIVPHFHLEDVWLFRTPGAGPDDFPIMLQALRADGGLHNQSGASRLLFSIRWKLGGLFGWDDPTEGTGDRVRSLIERLPDDLHQPVTGTLMPDTPFVALYELPDEAAYELANRTVHDVLHLGWVQGTAGDYELRMAALVKPNGAFGRLYLAAIKPLRYLVVYPALTRQWERAWRDHHRRTAPRVASTVPPGDHLQTGDTQ